MSCSERSAKATIYDDSLMGVNLLCTETLAAAKTYRGEHRQRGGVVLAHTKY